MLQALSMKNSCKSTACTSSDSKDDFSDCVDVSVRGLQVGGGCGGLSFEREPKEPEDHEQPPVSEARAAVAAI